jgi:hypothetical protein
VLQLDQLALELIHKRVLVQLLLPAFISASVAGYQSITQGQTIYYFNIAQGCPTLFHLLNRGLRAMPIDLEDMLLEVLNLDMEEMQAMALPLSLLPTLEPAIPFNCLSQPLTFTVDFHPSVFSFCCQLRRACSVSNRWVTLLLLGLA